MRKWWGMQWNNTIICLMIATNSFLHMHFCFLSFHQHGDILKRGVYYLQSNNSTWKCYCDISTRTFFKRLNPPTQFYSIYHRYNLFFYVQHSKNKATILLQQLHFLFAHLQIANSFLCSDNFPGFCCLTNNCTPTLLLAGWLFAALLLTVKKFIVSSLDSEFDCNWNRYGRGRWKNEQKGEGKKRRGIEFYKDVKMKIQMKRSNGKKETKMRNKEKELKK